MAKDYVQLASNLGASLSEEHRYAVQNSYNQRNQQNHLSPQTNHKYSIHAHEIHEKRSDKEVSLSRSSSSRRSSELDLEAKLSQETEVGYKWMPQTPLKKGLSQPMAYAPTARQSTTPQIEPKRPQLIQVHQHTSPRNPNETVLDPNPPSKDDKNHSVLFNDGKRRIDFVLVYEQGVRLKPVDASRMGRSFVEKEKLRQFFQENLHKDGLELEEDVHKEENKSQQITVFVKVHGTWPALCRQAEILKIKMPLRLRDTFTNQLDDNKPCFIHRFIRQFKLLRKRLVGSCEHIGANMNSHIGVSSSEPGTVVTWAFQRKKIDKYAIHDQDSFFTPTQRMEMVWEILQKARNDPSDEKKRGIEQLLELGVYDAAFPLHDGSAGRRKHIRNNELCERQKLRQIWANWKCTFQRQPLELIRRYYGEKIGFYFAFLGFYTKMLTFPAIVGLCTFFYGLAYSGDDDLVNNICGDHKPMCPICQPPKCDVSPLADACNNAKWDYRMDNEATLAMACLSVIWATVFLKMWKRREAELAYEWDTYEVEQSDGVIRPEYEIRAPSRRNNPVTRELEPHVPTTRRACWMAASIFITLLMLGAVGVALACLVLARIALYGFFKHAGIANSVEWARWFVHGLIFIVVLIFDTIYNWIGRKTTSLECPRTQSQWLSSFLWKVFIFELLNDFVPIAYAAWVKGKSIRTPLDLTSRSELCDSGGCMGEVTELIAVLLLARLVVGNASEIGLPFLKQFLSRFICKKKTYNKQLAGFSSQSNMDDDDEKETATSRRQWNRDHILGELELDGVADEYMEMIVQFAFVTLFVPAFPVAPFVCLLNNILEIRVDSINFVVSHRRPLPIRVPGIQIWNSFMDIIAKVAILCNAGLMSFTSEMIPRLYYKYTINNGTNYDGFTEYSLSKIPTSAWLAIDNKAAYEELTSKNVSECYYQDYRYGPEKNYDVNQRWWEIMCVRLISFSVFIVAAFTFQWLYNFLVPDIPTRVQLKIQRRRYVVAKALEAEIAYDKWLKNTLQSKLPILPSPTSNNEQRIPYRPFTASKANAKRSPLTDQLNGNDSPIPMYASSNGSRYMNHYEYEMKDRI